MSSLRGSGVRRVAPLGPAVALAAIVGLCGCFLDSVGVAGGNGTGGQSQGGGGEGGGVVECTAPEDCGESTACVSFSCANETCVEEIAAEGTSCGEGRACDSIGQCIGDLGAMCGDAAECASGSCVDGVCCNTNCSAECQRCDVEGRVGTCGPSVIGTDLDAECANGTCDGSTGCATGSTMQAGSFGDTDGDHAKVWAVASNASGDGLLVGTFDGTADIGAGEVDAGPGEDAYFVRVDPAGDYHESLIATGGGDQILWAVDAVPGGGAVVGGQFATEIDFGEGPIASAGKNDLVVARLDEDAQPLWVFTAGDADEQTTIGVGVDANGDVYFAGSFEGTIDLGGGPLTSVEKLDVFVAKFNADGDHVWSFAYGDLGSQTVSGFDVNPDGTIAIVGRNDGLVNFGGDDLETEAAVDSWVAVFDTDGEHLSSRQLGGIGDQSVTTVAIDDDGAFALAGYFRGDIDLGSIPLISLEEDLFVASYDASGDYVWGERFGDSDAQRAWGVAIDSLGHIVIAGEFGGTVDFGLGELTDAGAHDVFAAKFGPLGEPVWARKFGDDKAQAANAVAAAPDRSLWLVGQFQGEMGTLVNMGGHDAFWARLSN